MAKVVGCETVKNGLVGAVRLRVGNGSFQILKRLADKTVLLLESEMIQFPNKGSHRGTK